jgi:DNA-directed RNA polymerase subunit M/transcription elongation factor TFIIS
MNSFTLISDSNNSSNVGNFEFLPSNASVYEGSESNSSSITMINGEIFVGNQLAFEPYCFSNHYSATASAPFPTEQCSPFSSQLTDQGYQSMIRSYPYIFSNNDQLQQYLTPPVDQALQSPHFHNNPVIPSYRSKSSLRKPRRRSRTSKDPNASKILKICMNCGISETPSWRRDKTNLLLLCNACGLYEKLHDKKRPIVNENGLVKLARGKSNSNSNRKSISRNTKEVGLVKCPKCGEAHDSYIADHFCKFDYFNDKL